MRIRFAVCEDEKDAAEVLNGYIDTLCASLGEEAQIFVFNSGEELLENYPEKLDILLLDIKMGELDGIETAKKIREQKKDVCIIFITSMAQYAIEGYRVRAFSFLTKPVQYEDFRIEVTAAIKKLKEARGKELLIREGQKVYRVRSASIYYIEVQNHKVILHLKDRALSFHGKISGLEEELKGWGFGRCHVAFLVSFRYVASVSAESLTLHNGEQIPVSRNRKKEFLKGMAEYLGGTV
ncbi:response regulator [Clostridium sp. MCC353]|uniref:LytR/AlgR family response regulator transcription factor n=1 Tax=Clostridium sp. MCC353 TaxID=2592646 RepID=UPI001C020374|nr:LytTR family DNA-binding domain-containing protein [Clostridium sp. MCC353]MBT9775179.1 response regulator [Clostridium sp. MCC353]